MNRSKLAFALKLGVLASTVFALSLTPVFAGGCLEPGGQWPLGPAGAVAAAGSLVIYSQGVTIEIADVSDPANPFVLGATEIPAVPFEIAVVGTLAFVAADDDGLFVVDFSEPTTPSVVGHWGGPPDRAWDVAAAGDHVFIASGRIIVLDVTDPANPLEISRETTWPVRRIELVGSHIYGIGTGFLVVYDVSTPSTPSIVFTQHSGSYSYVAANDQRLLTAYAGRLSVYTLDDPASPVFVTEYDDPTTYFQGPTADGTHAYLTTTHDEFAIVDTTDPANPSTTAIWPSPGDPRNVAIQGTMAFLTTEEGGLRLLDVTDPADPTEVGFIPSAGASIDLEIDGDHAFVAQRGSGLRVFDVSDPDLPTPIGFLALDEALGVTLDGTRAVVTSGEAGFFVIDISDPTTPTLLGGFDTPDEAWKAEVDGDLAYVADGDSGLQIYDISNPAAITQVGAMTNVQSAMDVAVDGHIAYLADSCWGLAVVDVSNPSTPVKISGNGSSNNHCAQAVVVMDNLAILVEGWHWPGNSGIMVYDVTNPSIPILITDFLQTADKWIGWDLAIEGDILYVAYERATVVFDLSNLLAPALIARHYAPGFSTGVDVVGDRVFIAAYTGGITSAICTACADAIFADGWEDFSWFYTAWSKVIPWP